MITIFGSIHQFSEKIVTFPKNNVMYDNFYRIYFGDNILKWYHWPQRFPEGFWAYGRNSCTCGSGIFSLAPFKKLHSVSLQFYNIGHLRIRPTTAADEGSYLCQISTHPPTILVTNLKIIGTLHPKIASYNASIVNFSQLQRCNFLLRQRCKFLHRQW
jgi:hypothetical protein